MVWVLVFVGGGLGSLCRYGLAALVQSRANGTFPVGTLVVNILGCIVIGVVARQVTTMQSDVMVRAALITGFCGGFTTFSAFSYETVALIGSGEWGKAALYVGASVAACLAGTAIGIGRLPMR
jgi:fluoride exporter